MSDSFFNTGLYKVFEPKWKDISGKPYITVSSKGISNGLSTIPNDGADFGPDTIGTQTSGIQEAINYIFNRGGGTVYLLGGLFDITNAPFQSDPNNSGASGQLIIPMQLGSSYQDTINIAIVSTGFVKGGTEEGEPTASFSGGATIRSLATNTETSPALLLAFSSPVGEGAGGTILSNVNLWIDGIHLQVSPTSTNSIAGCNLTNIVSSSIGLLYIDTYYANQTTPPSINSQFGLAWCTNNDVSITQYANFIYVSGFAIGLNTALVHGYIGKYVTQFNTIGINVVGGEGYNSGIINVFEVQDTATHINITGRFWATIVHYAWGDQATIAFVSNVNVTASTFACSLSILELSQANTIAVVCNLTQYSRVRIYNTLAWGGVSLYDITPTIPANPPISGTTYQNKNPFDIIIYLPVWATTALTAGTVTVNTGGGGGTNMTPIYVSGATSSTSSQMITLRVRAGWYFGFTATGTTFGTATVYQA